MSKRGKASIIMTGRKRALSGFRKVVPILSGTFHGSVTAKGVICVTGSAAGAENGKVYVSIDTAGTGTVCSD